jgi:hypothetical protein
MATDLPGDEASYCEETPQGDLIGVAYNVLICHLLDYIRSDNDGDCIKHTGARLGFFENKAKRRKNVEHSEEPLQIILRSGGCAGRANGVTGRSAGQTQYPGYLG